MTGPTRIHRHPEESVSVTCEARSSDRIATSAQKATRRRKLSVVDAVAKDIRDSILSGRVAQGDLLPRLDDLVRQFGTSKLTVREALRVLEIEGFVSVQRGNMGGAIAHFPTSDDAAYSLSLVFESQQVPVTELAESIERLEPVCIELCAERSDRTEAVMPLLVAAQSQLSECISRGDGDGAATAAQEWHRAIVSACGNRAASITLGALEAIWFSHSSTIAAHESAHGVEVSEVVLRRVYMEHAEIQEMIAAGSGADAAKALREHVRSTRPGAALVVYPAGSASRIPQVSATPVRDHMENAVRPRKG
jgi:DNA-binding FadR family transcriptional regulator